MRPDGETIARAARTIGQQVRDRTAMLLGRHRDTMRLFFDGKGIREEGVRWLDRLAEDNFVHGSAFHEDPREHARREGRRELALEIIASVRLDPVRLRREIEQLREDEA